jgi:uroporphyrinogen-III synthase
MTAPARNEADAVRDAAVSAPDLSGGGLAGRRVVNTRAAVQAAVLDRLIAERGGIALGYPCIEFRTPADTTPLDQAVRNAAAGAFDLIVFTSVNAVEAVAAALDRAGLPAGALAAARAAGPADTNPDPVCSSAAVGPITAAAAERLLSLRPAVVPRQYTGAELGTAIGAGDGRRLLLPQSDIAPPDLSETLAANGWSVARPQAYVTGIGSGGVDLPLLLSRGEVDAVLLTSPSTAANLMARMEAAGLPGGEPSVAALRNVCVGCIGPQTAAAARRLGLPVAVQPSTHTLPNLVAALDHHFATSAPKESVQ